MKKYLYTTLLSALLLSGTSCENAAVESQETDEISQDDKALSLMAANCFACHNPEMDGSSRVAPPLFMVRNHYYDSELSREDFIKNVKAFLNDPSEERSIMPGAVRNFGLMPKMSFKDEDLTLIAGYMYDHDLESDEWYELWKKFNKGDKTIERKVNYEDLGREIANKTKAELGKNLMAAVQTKGAVQAIDFCNTRALPITDSMSVLLDSKVKRVSDKPRNPLNKANTDELAYINTAKTTLLKGGKIQPKVVERNGKMLGYYPIETNDMCLKCHGTPNKTISPETLKAIKKHYPMDQATGYGINELRGIFVVEMNKRN